MATIDDSRPTTHQPFRWIWSYLQFERDTSALELHITSYKAFYALSAGDYGKGNHYCKILSPARAMEWIYTDGLR